MTLDWHIPILPPWQQLLFCSSSLYSWFGKLLEVDVMMMPFVSNYYFWVGFGLVLTLLKRNSSVIYLSYTFPSVFLSMFFVFSIDIWFLANYWVCLDCLESWRTWLFCGSQEPSTYYVLKVKASLHFCQKLVSFQMSVFLCKKYVTVIFACLITIIIFFDNRVTFHFPK